MKDKALNAWVAVCVVFGLFQAVAIVRARIKDSYKDRVIFADENKLSYLIVNGQKVLPKDGAIEIKIDNNPLVQTIVDGNTIRIGINILAPAATPQPMNGPHICCNASQAVPYLVKHPNQNPFSMDYWYYQPNPKDGEVVLDKEEVFTDTGKLMYSRDNLNNIDLTPKWYQGIPVHNEDSLEANRLGFPKNPQTLYRLVWNDKKKVYEYVH